MKRSHGFTVIEIIVAVLFISAATILLFIQRDNFAATTRDQQRKTAINAMYYNLEEVYYPKHKSYPAAIDSKALTAMDPELFNDPDGFPIGNALSDYRYDGVGCSNDQCQGYTLRADLEKEDDYIKENRN